MTDPVSSWPAGATVRGVRFAPRAGGAAAANGTSANGDGAALLSLPAPILRDAVPSANGKDADLTVLAIPAGEPEPADLSARAQAWVAPGGPETPGYHFVALHGAQVHWCLPRVAVVAPADRVESVVKAALEAAYLEQELAGVEAGLAEVWPDVEADAPLAFEVRPRDLARRPQLAARFQQLVRLRSRLAKVMPRLLVPQVYPPTLPSQVLERFRERLGTSYRVEALNVQFELFERVYEGCGQRTSDVALARKGLTLEWLIIVLLAVQTFLTVFEILTNHEDAQPQPSHTQPAHTQPGYDEEDEEPAATTQPGIMQPGTTHPATTRPATQPTARTQAGRPYYPQRRPIRRQ
ncbi:MAG TPA: hypothetical protein VF796_06585 [Humisphaera sp.]